MATPPPLPSRVPPPLPSQRVAPAGAPGAQTSGPYATPSQFDPESTRVSTRDVQRASGKTYSEWVSVNSTNVNRIRFDPEYDFQGNATGQGTITIEFLDLSMYEYPNRSVADWFDLFESSSKGSFAYYEVRGPGPSTKGMGIWSFRRLRGPQRKVTAAMRKARAPVTAMQKKRTYTVRGNRGGYRKGNLVVR